MANWKGFDKETALKVAREEEKIFIDIQNGEVNADHYIFFLKTFRSAEALMNSFQFKRKKKK